MLALKFFITTSAFFTLVDALSLCPVTDAASSRTTDESVNLRVYICTQKSSGYLSLCTKAKEVNTTKYALTDIKHEVNGYTIMTQIEDKGRVCFSWRDENDDCKTDCVYGSAFDMNYKKYANADYEIIRIIVAPDSTTKIDPRFCNINRAQDQNIKADAISVNVYDCTLEARGEPTCSTKPLLNDINLPKGKDVALNHKVNLYPVVAKFLGRRLCVSLREYHLNYTSYSCEVDCKDVFEKKTPKSYDDREGAVVGTYERTRMCTNGTCTEYGNKYLLFVRQSNSQTTKSNLMMVISFLMSAMLIKHITIQ